MTIENTYTLADFGRWLLWTAVFLGIALIAARFITFLIIRLIKRAGTDELFNKFVSRIASILIFTLTLILFLDWFGVNTTYLIAIFAAILFAIGVGLQDSLANLAAALRIFLFQPFRAGDEVDIDGKVGRVEEINLMTTNLRTSEKTKIILPNASVAKATITNFDAHEIRQVEIMIRVAYEQEIEQVRQVLVEALNEDENVLKDQPITIGVQELAETAVHVLIRAWVRNTNYGPAKRELNERIKRTFDEAGIRFPYPRFKIQ